MSPYPSVIAQAENTPHHVTAGTTFVEAAADQHRSPSQRQCCDTAGLSDVSSDFFANNAPVSEERTSPTSSADILTPIASSRESILSEGSDKEKRWSTAQPSLVTSPASFSRTVSPCSSVLSGIFSPAVVQIRKHFLAPGSSLIHTPQSCFSSCESLSSSFCPQSPPPRRRPPLTRLSLLTAILRKGRLPVLSPALQRPYTPCWPINPVTLSYCNACSAASSVASIPLELSSQFSSTMSIDSQSNIHRCSTAPPPVKSNEPSAAYPQIQVKSYSEQIRSSSTPRWEEVISPPPVKAGTIPQTPRPMFSSNYKAASFLPDIDAAASTKTQHSSISTSKSPKLEPSNTHISGHADNINTLFPPSSKVTDEHKSSALPNHRKNSSLSRLHMLSSKLRSPLRSLSPSPSPCSSPAPSPLPQSTAGSTEPDRSCPYSTNAAASEGFHKVQRLTPYHYTPIISLGRLSPASSRTLTPSPAPPSRDLSLSPSLSLRSTPSPRPGSGISDCSNREGKKRKVVVLSVTCMTF